MPTFGVLAAAGLVCGLLLSGKTAEWAGLDEGKLWNAGLFAVIAAFGFSRALLGIAHFKSYAAYPVLLLAVPSLTASGVLLTVLATGVWLWWRQIPVGRALDAWAPCGALVWAFLALGHWAEGSDPGLWGRPVGLYAAGLGLAIAALGVWCLRHTGTAAGVVLIAVGSGQFFLSFLRVPGDYFHGLDLLQWVALGLVVVGGMRIVSGKTHARLTLS